MRLTYIDLIKAIECEATTRIIGKIDCECLKETNGDNLLYIFPLIERMVLEIYKVFPGANVEHYKQGVMKTINSIFDSNRDLDVLPCELIKKIKKYYSENGIRNQMFHITEQTINFEVNYYELHYIIMHLLSILKKVYLNTPILTPKIREI